MLLFYFEINEENTFCIYKPLGNWKQRVELKETAYVSLEVQSVNKESVEHNKRANKLLKLTLVYGVAILNSMLGHVGLKK